MLRYDLHDSNTAEELLDEVSVLLGSSLAKADCRSPAAHQRRCVDSASDNPGVGDELAAIWQKKVTFQKIALLKIWFVTQDCKIPQTRLRFSWILWHGRPAMTETKSFESWQRKDGTGSAEASEGVAVTSLIQPSMTEGKMCGLTARKMTSAARMTSVFLWEVVAPSCRHRARFRSDGALANT